MVKIAKKQIKKSNIKDMEETLRLFYGKTKRNDHWYCDKCGKKFADKNASKVQVLNNYKKHHKKHHKKVLWCSKCKKYHFIGSGIARDHKYYLKPKRGK